MGSKIACERCGHDARPSAGLPGVCERCAGEPVTQVCGNCGAEAMNYSKGRCGACSLRDRVEEIASRGDPEAVAVLRPYLDALAASPKPHSTLNWITTSKTFPILEQLINGQLPITHEALDSIGPAHKTRHLRTMLLQHGALPERSELTAGLASLIEEQVKRIPDSADRLHLRAFATWRVQHDLARKERQGNAARHADMRARVLVRVATDLLVWLTTHDFQLATLKQEHLEWWLAQGSDHRRHIRAFITWTAKHKITTGLEVLPAATRRHIDPLDPDHRHELLHTLLNDEQVDLRDRVAGLLIVVLTQRISHIVLLARDDVIEQDGQILLRIGRDPLLLPEPIATLVHRLKNDSNSTWLFHGGRYGNHLSETYMRERLTRIGLKALPARAAATNQLASTLPAAILADLLGFSDQTTERWTKHAAGDWTRYIAHRPNQRAARDSQSPVALRAPGS